MERSGIKQDSGIFKIHPHLPIISFSPFYTPCLVFFLEKLD